MNIRIKGKNIVVGLGFAVAASLAMPAVAAGAHAHAGSHAAGHAGSGATHSYTRTTQTQRTADGHTSHSSRTDAQGRTATRDASVVNDKETGTRTKDVTFTGKDGETRSVDSITQRTDSGYTRDTTYTDKNGNTATREADVIHDADTHSTVKTVTVERTPAP